MPEQLNITNLPSSRVEFIDPRTGLMSREWYRFFLNLFTLTGGGNNQTSLDDLQLAPPFVPSSGGTGTVTSVGTAGTVNGITLTGGTITTSGTITLGGTLSNVSLTTQVTGNLPVTNLNSGTSASATTFWRGDGSWATVISGAALSNDTATATNVFPLFADAITGTPTTIYTSNANLLYKPSTGEFLAQQFNAGNGIYVNSKTVSTSYTIATGNSGMSAGPITIASGQTVTVASGSRWVVL